jgi:transcriptional regulator NrdR family protein
MYVKKRKGKVEKFSVQKIIKSCRKAGAKANEARKVAEEVMEKLAIPTKKIGMNVIRSLKKVNKEAAKNFEKFFKKKWK